MRTHKWYTRLVWHHLKVQCAVRAHAHPLGAALSEYATPFAVLRSYADIQSYIRQQASKTPRGEWILVPKTFPGRLQEMRMPTRDVLDATQDEPAGAIAVDHVFRLLGFAYPSEPLQNAYRALRSGDDYLRRTSLEYLEQILPLGVWQHILPLVDEKNTESQTTVH